MTRAADHAPPAQRKDTILEEGITNSHDIGPRTKELYLYCVRDFLSYAGHSPGDWRLRTVEAWVQKLLTERELKPQTVRVYRKAILYASRRYATLEERPELDFAAKASKIKVTTTAPRAPLTYEEAGRMLTTCDESLTGIRDRALLVLALKTGLRREGLRAINFEGIEHRPDKITTINKGGNELTFEPDAESMHALNVWLALLRKKGITTGAVFRHILEPDHLGDRMSAFQIWYVFRRRAKQVGVREGHVFPHLARHTTVTWLREEGQTAAQIRNLTGQSEKTIEDIYTHVRAKGAVGAVLPPLLTPKRAPKR